MFINDTSRLPDSGRICVMGFQVDAALPKTYFSLSINAARAEVEPMNEPRNPAHEMRFPVSRKDGGNAPARCRQSAEAAAGSPSREPRAAGSIHTPQSRRW